MSGDSFEENINRHEAYLALKLGLKRGMRVLVSTTYAVINGQSV